MTSYAVRTRSPVTSRAALVYAHKNETIDVIMSKSEILLPSEICKNTHFFTLHLAVTKKPWVMEKKYLHI